MCAMLTGVEPADSGDEQPVSDLELRIPPKQPYEGKATQRQKQKLWDLGFRDKEIIDALGKRQASVLIEQIVSTARDIHTDRRRKTYRTIGAILLGIFVLTLVSGRLGLRLNEDFIAFVLVGSFFGGTVIFLLGVPSPFTTRRKKRDI